MAKTRVFRFQTSAQLAQAVATRLAERLIELQQEKPVINLGLTGGRIAAEIYRNFAKLAENQKLPTQNLHLWWSDERFVSTTSPERNSQQALAILGKSVPLVSSLIHLMPASDGKKDPDEAAFAYANELGETRFDICLLGIGEDGHVGSIFPNHPSFTSITHSSVIGVTDSPKSPSERISLTLETINESAEIWVVAAGIEKADALAKALAKENTPAGQLCAQQATYWFVDQDAASNLAYYQCKL